jgi:putative aminopeptidase FrvX
VISEFTNKVVALINDEKMRIDFGANSRQKLVKSGVNPADFAELHMSLYEMLYVENTSKCLKYFLFLIFNLFFLPVCDCL